MGLFKGGALRLLQTSLYAILFCCTGLIVAVYAYYLAILADQNLHIPTWERAVEGIAGVASIYLIFAVFLTCCLGGVTFLAFLAVVIDLAFAAGMIAIAVMTRGGASSCAGPIVNTPIGNGKADYGSDPAHDGDYDDGDGDDDSSHRIAPRDYDLTYTFHLGTACRLNTACFAVSLLAIFLFLATAALQLALVRHHKKEKRFGPGPSNNYTSGSGRRFAFFGRNKQSATKDIEPAGPDTIRSSGAHPFRPSHETGYTGSTTVADGNASAYDKVTGSGAQDDYYHNASGNPYGYESRPAANNNTYNPNS